jgi:hypothetical protein
MPLQITLRGTTELPPRLDALLAGMRVTDRQQLVIAGAAASCAADEHRLARWITGVYKARWLRLSMCLDCETVEVRDVTRELIPTVSPSVNSPDELLGWYSGSRVNGRVHL